MLVAPGSSLGGARPKASVIDEKGSLWIAKFPSVNDDYDVGAWEMLLHKLALSAEIIVPEAQLRKFNSRHHTFLTKRFDRAAANQRIHFVSAMTLLQRQDDDDAAKGASYLEIAEFMMQRSQEPLKDLEQLWRRIVFNICVSNVDDHLRNHRFLLRQNSWMLSPAYDMNPVATGNGLKLNISSTDNAQALALVLEVSKYFRLSPAKAKKIMNAMVKKVKSWREEATALKISSAEQDHMAREFRVADDF